MRFEVWLGQIDEEAVGGFRRWSNVPIKFENEQTLAEFISQSTHAPHSQVRAVIGQYERDGAYEAFFPIKNSEMTNLAYELDIIEEMPKEVLDAVLLLRAKLQNMSESEVKDMLDIWYIESDKIFKGLLDLADYLDYEEEVKVENQDDPLRLDVYYKESRGSNEILQISEKKVGDAAAFLSSRTFIAPEVLVDEIFTGLAFERGYKSMQAPGHFYVRRSSDAEAPRFDIYFESKHGKEIRFEGCLPDDAARKIQMKTGIDCDAVLGQIYNGTYKGRAYRDEKECYYYIEKAEA